MVLNIYRAADSFLYLPTYIAEDLEIFKTLLKDCVIDSVEFPPLNKGDEGDFGAINSMIKENRNSKKSISIAIADPTSFLSIEKGISKDIIDECCVFGAIIDKLPFWAVNHKQVKFSSYKEFSNVFSKIIHYEEEWATGYYLGKKIKREAGLESERVAFGEEIKKLDELNSITKRACAITADIVEIAKRKKNEDSKVINPLEVNYEFTEQGNFLTTGLITSNYICNANKEVFVRIIEGIKKSILILYSSEEVARRICNQIALKQNITDLTEINYSTIVRMIYDGKFYPANLSITKKLWKSSLEALSYTERWDSIKEIEVNEVIEATYNHNVNNEFVYAANESLITQLGINKSNMNQEISDLFKTIKSKQISLKSIEDNINQNRKLVRILNFITYVPRKFLILKKYPKYFVLISFVLSIFLALVCFLITKFVDEKSLIYKIADIGQYIFSIIFVIVPTLPPIIDNINKRK